MLLALETVGSSNSLMAGTQALAATLENLKTLPYPDEIELPDANLVMCYPRRPRNSARYQWLAQQISPILSR